MASFPERIGHLNPRETLQITDLSSETRVDLWNVLVIVREFLTRVGTQGVLLQESRIAKRLWASHFRKPLDEFYESQLWKMVKERIHHGSAVEALWVIEDMVHAYKEEVGGSESEQIAPHFNVQLKKNLVGYRFIAGWLVPVTNEVEVAEIERALAVTADKTGAQTHLRNALDLLGRRDSPQFAKSLSESIHAVEAIVRDATGKQTLGAGLKVLESKGITIHPALAEAWSKLYGYSSDGDGIRHGSITDADVDEALAAYFLVTCSAFVNYLLKKSTD